MAGGCACRFFGELVQLAAAAGTGSLLTQYAGQGSERRRARAEVRDALMAVERMWWPYSWSEDGPDDERSMYADKLLAARRQFVSAALVARLPREAVLTYDHAAMAGREAAKVQLRKTGNVDGGVPLPLAECVDSALELATDLLWHPWWTRLTYRKRLGALKQQIDDAKEQPGGGTLRWSYGRP